MWYNIPTMDRRNFLQKQKTKVPLDGIKVSAGSGVFLSDVRRIREEHKQKRFATLLFSRGRRSASFFTEDSGKYISPRQKELLTHGARFIDRRATFDGAKQRVVFAQAHSDVLYDYLSRKYRSARFSIATVRDLLSQNISPLKMWNMSLIGAMLFGMISMALIYRHFGQSAAAQGGLMIASTQPTVGVEQQVLGAYAERGSTDVTVPTDGVTVPDFEQGSAAFIEGVMRDLEDTRKEEFEARVREMVKGYPIEAMVPYIIEKDQTVAAFLIGIAKKESNWGKRVPVLNGQDCYNYWGYRGQRRLMGTGGHTCFNSRKDAVDTVAKRIEFLVSNKKLNTPEKMIIWKCGSSCAGHSSYSVAKWISDVELYFEKLNN